MVQAGNMNMRSLSLSISGPAISMPTRSAAPPETAMTGDPLSPGNVTGLPSPAATMINSEKQKSSGNVTPLRVTLYGIKKEAKEVVERMGKWTTARRRERFDGRKLSESAGLV